MLELDVVVPGAVVRPHSVRSLWIGAMIRYEDLNWAMESVACSAYG